MEERKIIRSEKVGRVKKIYLTNKGTEMAKKINEFQHIMENTSPVASQEAREPSMKPVRKKKHTPLWDKLEKYEGYINSIDKNLKIKNRREYAKNARLLGRHINSLKKLRPKEKKTKEYKYNLLEKAESMKRKISAYLKNYKVK